MTDRRPFAALSARSLYLWAAVLALLSTTLLHIAWWHPYCDAQSDGPGFYAWGFPLPYAAPTGVSSLEFTWLPHVLAFNLAVMGCVAFALLWLLFRRRAPASTALARIGSITALVLVVLLAAFNGMWLSGPGIPRWSPAWSADSYGSYRPAVLAVGAGHRACDS